MRHRWQGGPWTGRKGHFILGGYRQEAGIMDSHMDRAAACGGSSGDRKKYPA